MEMEYPWRTIHQVTSNPIFSKVKIGDEVAILQHEEDFWWIGKVVGINTYAGRSNRYQERPVLSVACTEPVVRQRCFYEDAVSEILFKD